jgi:short subunit dehydrogenase-like uncharacterized protein
VGGNLLLYGATGYTGRLVLDAALAAGLRPILGGRDERRLAALAGAHGLAYRVAGLDDPGTLAKALDGMGAVLLAAGPFSLTAGPMLDACLHAGVHYLDISGEVLVLEATAARHADALRRGVMLLPGVGFDVVPSDCLAAHVARRLPGATRLFLGLRGMELLTRGSAVTIVESLGAMSRVRRDGRIVTVTPGTLERSFDFGDGPSTGTCIGWGDVATAYYTTGIPNVEVYFEAIAPVRATLLNTRFFGWLYGLPLWRALAHGRRPPAPGRTDGGGARRRADGRSSPKSRTGGEDARSRSTRPRRLRSPPRARLRSLRRVLAGRRRAGIPDARAAFWTGSRAHASERDAGGPRMTSAGAKNFFLREPRFC